MFRKLYFICIASLFLGNEDLNAQQIEFIKSADMPRVNYYSSGFNERFRSYGETNTIKIHLTYLYKQKKVKKIKVFLPDNHLYCAFDLDTSGRQVGGAYRGYYFTVWNSYVLNTGSSVMTTNWFKDTLLIRSDTVYTSPVVYSHKDTCMSFVRHITKTHKRGLLINEQNTYFNENYYNKPVKHQQYLWSSVVVSHNKKNNVKIPVVASSLYFDKKLKNTYEPGLLYYCGEIRVDEGVYASSDSGRKQIHDKISPNHRFYKTRSTTIFRDTLVDGENFEEPSELHQAMYCGNAMYSDNIRAIEKHFEEFRTTLNDKGLYDTCFHYYFPPDTLGSAAEASAKAKAAAERERQAKENPGNVAVITGGSPYSFYENYPFKKRSQVPVKTLMYVIRYEYFQ